jgi:hypothetical protein
MNRISFDTIYNRRSLYQVTAVKLNRKKFHMANCNVQANNKNGHVIKGARFSRGLCRQEVNTDFTHIRYILSYLKIAF